MTDRPQSIRPYIKVDSGKWLERHDREIETLKAADVSFAKYLENKDKAGVWWRWAIGLAWPVLIGLIGTGFASYHAIAQLQREEKVRSERVERAVVTYDTLKELEEEITELKEQRKKLIERIEQMERFHPRRKSHPR